MTPNKILKIRLKKAILFISLISFAAILMTSCSQWEVAGIGEGDTGGGGPQEEVKYKRAIMSTDDGKTENESTLNLNTNN